MSNRNSSRRSSPASHSGTDAEDPVERPSTTSAGAPVRTAPRSQPRTCTSSSSGGSRSRRLRTAPGTRTSAPSRSAERESIRRPSCSVASRPGAGSCSRRRNRGSGISRSHPERLDQRLKGRWLVTPARVVEEVAVERRTPVLKDPHELAACEVVGHMLLEHVGQSQPV